MKDIITITVTKEKENLYNVTKLENNIHKTFTNITYKEVCNLILTM